MYKNYKVIFALVITVVCGTLYASEVLTKKDDGHNTSLVAENQQDSTCSFDLSDSKEIQGKLILGQKEWVYFPMIDQSYRARIDTGAAISSVDASKLTFFKRNGKKWARFRIEHRGKLSDEFVLPVKRWVRVKQASDEAGSRRAIVEIQIKIGATLQKTEFTLADRGHLSFPVLLGRGYINHHALVDVSRRYVQGSEHKK